MAPNKKSPINYYFLLKCLGALSVAAVVTAAVITANAAKIGTSGLVASSLIMTNPFIFPFAVLGAMLTGICLLTCLGAGAAPPRAHATRYFGVAPGYGYGQFFANPVAIEQHRGYPPAHGDTHTHTHTHNGSVYPRVEPDNQHGHGGGGFGFGNTHGHG